MNPDNQNVPLTQPTVSPPTQPPTQPVAGPDLTQSTAPQQSKNKGKLLLIIVLVLLVLAGGGVAAYKVLTSDSNDTKATNTTEATDKTADTKTDAAATTDTTSTSTAAKDAARKAALNALATDIEKYYGEMVYYPTATQMNTASFTSSNMTTFNKIKASSTETSGMTVSSTLSDTTFAYKATPDGCNNTSKDCTKFEVSVKVTEKQSDGTYIYKKSALN